MNAHLQPTGSAYFIAKETEKVEKHTLSVLVDNEPGVLARVIGLFSGRGYNIESLTVAPTEDPTLSRLTLTTVGHDEVIEQIMENDRIFQRMGVVEEVMSELFDAGHKYALGQLEANDDLRLLILKGMIALIGLEGIQFISSFSATFALAEQQLFVGACKLIQKIMLDEILHVKMDYAIIDALMKDPEWKRVYDDNIEELTGILDTIVLQEEDWCDYLFSEGRVIVGLNAELSKQWVYFNAAPIYRRLKMKPKFRAPKQTPLPWMDIWLNPDQIQVAAQEIQRTDYKLNSANKDVADEIGRAHV